MTFIFNQKWGKVLQGTAIIHFFVKRRIYHIYSKSVMMKIGRKTLRKLHTFYNFVKTIFNESKTDIIVIMSCCAII